MGLRLPGFDANNLTDGENQVVDIEVEGKESRIVAFREHLETNRPSGAEVSNISVSDYDGDIMRMAGYSQILTAMLMLKAFPIILEIRDSTRRSIRPLGGLTDSERPTISCQAVLLKSRL